MTTMTRPTQSGMTLIEVLVGILLFTILAAGAFAALSGQQETTSFQQRSESTVDSARALLNIMAMQARAAKGAAPNGAVIFNSNAGVPLDAAPSLTGANCSTVSGEYQAPVVQVVNGQGEGGSDVLRILYPDGSGWGQLVTEFSNGVQSLGLRMRMDRPAAPPLLPAGVVPDVNDWILVSDFRRNSIMFQATAIEVGTNCVSVTPTPLATDWCMTTPATSSATVPYPLDPGGPALLNNAFFIKARWIEYRIVTGNQLRVTDLLAGTTEPAADGVEDLQVALGYDRSTPLDGLIDDTEWLSNDGDINTVGFCNMRPLRAVRIGLVVRATSEAKGARSSRPTLEEHAGGPQDGFYRVLVQSVVAFRASSD